MAFLLKCFDRLKRQINPIKYWRKKGTKIGNNCEIYPTVSIDSEPYLVDIGSHVRINSGTHLITHDGACWVARYLKEELHDCDLFRRITIGNNVSIGTNSIILPGVTIGDNSIIGAGALVSKNIPPNSVAAGVPARIIETTDEYISKHQNDFLHTKGMSSKNKRKIVLERIKKK